MFENDYALKAMSLFQSFVFSISSLFQYFSKLVGTWTTDILEGLVSCEYTDGSVAEGWVHGGSWHGVYRRFSPDGSLAVYGKCRNGKLSGKCWKFFSEAGGGALYGNVGHNNLIEGDDVVHLYPDLVTGIQVAKHSFL